MSVCHCVKTCCLQVYTLLYKLFILCWKTYRSFFFFFLSFCLIFYLFFYLFIISFEFRKLVTAHQEQKKKKEKKEELHKSVVLFFYTVLFGSVHLCAPLRYRPVCLHWHTHRHTGALEQIKVDVFISYFLYP